MMNDYFKKYLSAGKNQEQSDDKSEDLKNTNTTIPVPLIEKSVKTIQAKKMNFDLIIKNGRVVIPEQGIVNSNVYIHEGKIVAVGDLKDVSAHRFIDAYGKYVLPGIVDPHVHFGIYTSMESEITSETKSAIVGGVTTVGSYFLTERTHFDSLPKVEALVEQLSYVDVIPHLVIQTQEQKDEIPDYENILGVKSFKLYMNGIPGFIPNVGDDFILDVLEKVDHNSIVSVHSENSTLVKRATRLQRELVGEDATLTNWNLCHPDYAEEDAALRMLNFSNLLKKQIYLVHISTARTIRALSKFNAERPYLSIETTSPYLSVVLENDNYKKMTPPLRNQEDIDALWEAFNQGVIDTIGTDHVAIFREGTESMWDTLSGFSVVEHHLPVLWHEGISNNKTDILRLIVSMTQKPAQLFGVYPQKGTILPGSDADIVILDPTLEKTIYHEDLISLGNYSIYNGKRIKGWPVMTIKNGEVIVDNGIIIQKPSASNVIKRF